MSNYSKITDYAAKDLLLHGDAAKAIKGTEVGAEFDAIATMSATKVDSGGALGTPSSGTLTSCTGLPISTGVSGLGTGVATALAVNIGSAGAPVTNGGALGTPSSGTLTNCTGLPLAAVTDSTTEALGVGSIELGHATDTTISRVSAGTIAVEGVNVYTTATGAALAGSSAQTFSVSTATSAAHAPRASQLSTHKVLPVNGCCMIDQVNAGALITPLTNSYPIDNVTISLAQASKLQTQQITTTLLTLNASHALRTSVLAQYAAGVAEQFWEGFPLEGIDFANWQWGTANAAAVSLQFKARASVSGTYSGSIRNAAVNRSYPFSFALTANTDTLVKVENISGDTTGTWPATEVVGAYLTFDLGSGTNLLGTAGAWAAANYVGVTGSTAFVNQANGSTLDITDVFINEGSFCKEFPKQKKSTVLDDCLRYLPRIPASTVNSVHHASTTLSASNLQFKVLARTAPTGITVPAMANFSLSNYSGAGGTPSAIAFSSASTFAGRVSVTTTAGAPTIVAGDTGEITIGASGYIQFDGARI